MSNIQSIFNDLSDDVNSLINKRRTITSWWIYNLNNTIITPSPEDIYKWINEAEINLEECDKKLANIYSDDYIPQF